MSAQPKVSVLMLTYNHERFIEQAVRNALAQETPFAYEIVIGEDCSTDRTREILTRLADAHPQLRLLFREKNLGGPQNMLDTYQACRGEYIALLEGDDYWTDSAKLRKQVEVLDVHSEWSMCFHRAQLVDEHGIPTGRFLPDLEWAAQPSLETLLHGNFIATQSVMYRAGLVHSFPLEFRSFVNGDWLIHILHACHGGIGFLPDVMSCYRVHQSGLWTSKPQPERIAEVIAGYTRLETILGPDYVQQLRRARNAYAQGAINGPLEELEKSFSLRLGRVLTWPLRVFYEVFARHRT
jgi:glycosyltransferase involved in cell wall biosynthesis